MLSPTFKEIESTTSPPPEPFTASAALVKGNTKINNSDAASMLGLGPPHIPPSKGGKKSRRVKSRKVRRVKTRKTRVNRRRKTSRK